MFWDSYWRTRTAGTHCLVATSPPYVRSTGLTDDILQTLVRVNGRAVVALSALAALGEVDDGLRVLAETVEGLNTALGDHLRRSAVARGFRLQGREGRE